MAKDVDLSSKEWRDLIFEGKNKDFGAYKMRQASDSRHNKAFIFVLIGLVVVSVLIFSLVKVQEEMARRDALIAQAQEQKMAQMEMEQPEEEEEEEVIIEIEEPETPPEEIVNQQKMTEIAIVDDNEVKDEDAVKSQSDLEQNTAIAGALDFDEGTDDISKITEQKVEIIQEKPVEKKAEKVFTHVEQMPQFPGGDAELYKFISNNLNYPAMAIENNVQGRVIVQFVVTADGSIGNVKVVRSVDRDLDNEAMRVCKKLPKFIPGKQNGQPVNVWYTLPVTFKLQQ